MRSFYLPFLLLFSTSIAQAAQGNIQPESACGPVFYELASLPKELPSLGEEVCATTKNIAQNGTQLIHQNYVLGDTTLDEFFSAYTEKLIAGGWEITNRDKPGIGPSGFMLSIQAEHSKGYFLQIVMSDIMQRGLAAFKRDKKARQRINIKLILSEK